MDRSSNRQGWRAGQVSRYRRRSSAYERRRGQEGCQVCVIRVDKGGRDADSPPLMQPWLMCLASSTSKGVAPLARPAPSRTTLRPPARFVPRTRPFTASHADTSSPLLRRSRSVNGTPKAAASLDTRCALFVAPSWARVAYPFPANSVREIGRAHV